MRKTIACLAVGAMALMTAPAQAEKTELRVPLGAGGFGFLPLHMMKKHQLVEKEAEKLGLKLTVNYANIGGPSVMNDALLSGSADFISAGPPAFLILWDRTKGRGDVMGVAAMSTIPMYLNTKAEHLTKIEDLKADDKIAVTAIKVSIPAIIMQMYARQKEGADATFKYDKYTVSMTHPDAVVAILSGNKQVTAHYASAPFHQRVIAASLDVHAQQRFGIRAAQVKAPFAEIHAEAVATIDFMGQAGIVRLHPFEYRAGIGNLCIDFSADRIAFDTLVNHLGERSVLGRNHFAE